MQKLMIGLAMVVLTGLVCTAPAEPLETETVEAAEPLRLAVGLTDGSCIIGAPVVATIGMHTVFGRIEVPLAHVESITFDTDNENVTIVLTTGDRISGVHELETLRLTTIVGDVGIDAFHIRHIERKTP